MDDGKRSMILGISSQVQVKVRPQHNKTFVCATKTTLSPHLKCMVESAPVHF